MRFVTAAIADMPVMVGTFVLYPSYPVGPVHAIQYVDGETPCAFFRHGRERAAVATGWVSLLHDMTCYA